MKFDYKSILRNRYILYLFFVLVLIQLILYLNLGEYSYVAIMIAIGWFVSRFNKNMIIVLFVTLILTHLVKVFMAANTREGIDETISSGSGDDKGTTVTVSAPTEPSATTTSSTASTATMSSLDIKQTIQEQEDKKKEIQNQINDIYLNNKKEIANLEVVLKEAQAAQASIPSA